MKSFVCQEERVKLENLKDDVGSVEKDDVGSVEKVIQAAVTAAFAGKGAA